MKRVLLTAVTSSLLFAYPGYGMSRLEKIAKMEADMKAMLDQKKESIGRNEAATKTEQEKAQKMAEASKKKQEELKKQLADINNEIENVASEEQLKTLNDKVKKLLKKVESTQRGNNHIGNNFQDQRENYLIPKTKKYKHEATKIMRQTIENLNKLESDLDLKGYLKDKKREKKKK